MLGIVPFVDLIGFFLTVRSPPISFMASVKPLGFLVVLGINSDWVGEPEFLI